MKRIIYTLLVFIFAIGNINAEKWITHKVKEPGNDDFDEPYDIVDEYTETGEDGETINFLDCIGSGDKACNWDISYNPLGGDIYSGPPPIPLDAEITDNNGNIITVDIREINNIIINRINDGENSGIVEVTDAEVQFTYNFSNEEDSQKLKVVSLTGRDMI